MSNERDELIAELDRLEQAIGAFLAEHASSEVSSATATDALRRRLMDFRKELKHLDRVSLDNLKAVRSHLSGGKRTQPSSPQAAVAPDKPGLSKQRDLAFERLRDFSRNATEMIISDPYFFAGDSRCCSAYVAEIVKAARLKGSSLKKLHILFDSRCGDTKVISSAVKKACSDHRVSFSRCDTSMVHDRFWIKDRSKALIVGTSLGGIGRKLCFITPMLDEDLLDVLAIIRDNKLD